MTNRSNSALERFLPEQRLFLKTQTKTRVIHLRPMTQLGLLGGTAILVGWAIVSGALLAYDRIGAPEGDIALSNLVIYLASTAKSNASYMALAGQGPMLPNSAPSRCRCTCATRRRG